MDIIYCAGGNIRLAAIAIEEGFLYGARSDDIRTIRCNGLIDINWDCYNWKRHLNIVAAHQPKYAVVPDILNYRYLHRTLRLADQLRRFCSRVIIVPKIQNIIKYIPNEYVIGVSVPTTYAGYIPSISELIGRDIHLLGGTPGQQRELWCYYRKMGTSVVSVDTNSHNKASDFGSFWDGYHWCDRERNNIGKYQAFRKSCQGIMKMWRELGAI